MEHCKSMFKPTVSVVDKGVISKVALKSWIISKNFWLGREPSRNYKDKQTKGTVTKWGVVLLMFKTIYIKKKE